MFQSANALQIYHYFVKYSATTLDLKWEGTDHLKESKDSEEMTNKDCMREYIMRNIEQCLYPGSITSSMDFDLIKQFVDRIPDDQELDPNWLFDVARQCQDKLGTGFKHLMKGKTITNLQL